jgi:hypothetical protein
MPSLPITNFSKLLKSLPSTLALWPACYTLGIYLLARLALALPTSDWQTISLILLIAHACYLFDRAKLSDSRQDPADAIGLPQRSLFFTRFARSIRVLIALELLTACVLAYAIAPLLSLVPIGALVGVHLYAGRAATPTKPRIKDIPGLKAFLIAGAHIALLVAVLRGNGQLDTQQLSISTVLLFIGLCLIVSSDATLCDLDDRRSDALYSTRSVPVLIGETPAWIFAQLLLIIGATLLITTSTETLTLLRIMLVLICTGLPTAWIKNRRDLIDARLLPVVLIALILA